MRKSLILFALLGFIASASAQIEFGLKGGLSSLDLISEGIDVNNGSSKVKIDFRDASYGHHFGLYTRIKFMGMYVEPAALFNSNQVNYSLTDYSEGDVVTKLFSEKYYNLDIPLMAGIKAGIFRLWRTCSPHPPQFYF